MDYLLELGKQHAARNLARKMGVALPPALRRAKRPWRHTFLDDAAVAVRRGPDPACDQALARVLAPAGARVVWPEGEPLPEVFAFAAEGWARPVIRVASDAELELRGLVYDATGIASDDDLDGCYEFFHAAVSRLERCGRVVVLGRPTDGGDPYVDAARAGLEGFVRSLAKELGRKGSTANLLLIEPGAEARLDMPLRFFLSPNSAFVSGQPLLIDTRCAGSSEPPVYERSLVGKVALVTGASGGIGAATAEALAAEGATVVVLDRPGTESMASKLVRRIGGSLLLTDITDAAAPQYIRDTLVERHGGVDIVVHNAGITADKTLSRMSSEAWSAVLDVNLRAVHRTTDALLADGCLRDGGRLIVLSSVGGIAGNVGQTNYAASKAGLIGYARCLAQRLAPRGITVNAVAPGFIETRMTAKMPVAVREAARRLSSLKQGGLPVDVAAAITFLALPTSSGCTGRVLRVCGGALIGA